VRAGLLALPVAAGAQVQAGAAYTVAAVGALADIQGRIFPDDLGAPASGNAKVRVIHAAPEVPAVDVAVEDGPTLFKGARFPSATDDAEVDPATYPIQVKAGGGGDVLLEASLPVKAGTVYSVAAIGGAGKDVRLLPVVDATGMGQMPSGGVATGRGGTAPAAGAERPRCRRGPGRAGRAAGGRGVGQRGAAPACRLTDGSPGWPG
jgi:hypothetical protein